MMKDEKGEMTDIGIKISNVLKDFEDPTSAEAINKAADETGVSAEDVRAFLDEWKDCVAENQQQEIERISEILFEHLCYFRVPPLWQLIKSHDVLWDKKNKRNEEQKKRKQVFLKKELKKKLKEMEKTENKEEMMMSLQSMMDQLKNS